jgi:hypothetical protein
MFDEPADAWREYWETALERRREQLERAARDPLGAWLVAEAPALVENDVVDPVALRDDPDAVLAAAHDGFESLVADGDLPGHDDDRYGYETLPVHVTAVGRVDGVDYSLSDPVDGANELRTLRSAAVVDEPTRRHEAGVVTYRCPLGHETSVRQPLLRTWPVETCPENDCEQGVVPDDARTRARRVARFTVETDARTLPCVATGRVAAGEAFDRLADARRLHLTGVVRLLADASGSFDPTCEVLAAEPASP